MSMNIFRLAGDASHVIAICILLRQLLWKQEARGISLKTQELFLLVFVTRYLDLLTTFYSLYNSVMKIFYVTTSLCVLKMLRFPTGRLEESYVPQEDTFRHWYAVLSCAALSVAVHVSGSGLHRFDFLELLWTFSILQESVAMVPQLVIMHSFGGWEPALGGYVLFMWLYRTMYIGNWVYRSYQEPMYQHHFLVYACGGLQCLVIVAAWCIRKGRAGRASVDEAREGVDYTLLEENDKEVQDKGPAGPIILDLDEASDEKLSVAISDQEDEDVDDA